LAVGQVKVAVGLSGGVDSSVAAALLQEEGYQVIGLAMKIFDGSPTAQESEKHACFGPGEKEDLARAAAVCERIGIPFEAIDLRREYRNHVIGYFRNEYLAGRTPNPCVVCNHKLKFGFLLQKAKEAGIDFDFFATGHYARIAEYRGRFLLKKAADPTKDQTYFLYALTPEQLCRTLFPLGAYTKQQIREIARSLGLETAEQTESQDFIAGGDYSTLFNEEEMKQGDIVDEEGNIRGKHRGIVGYTLGQRQGLGIAADRPLYVVKIDAQNNRIVVGDRENLYAQGLIASDLHLSAVDKLDRPYRVKVKIRLKHREAEATALPHEHGKAKIMFDKPQWAVTPGQVAVLYSDDTVFGGGVIERWLPADEAVR